MPRLAGPGIVDSKVAEGDDDVSVGDQKFHCHFYKIVTQRDEISTTWTIWISPNVPGGVVKQVSETTKGGKATSSMTDKLEAFQLSPRK
jgi:hypothetical protein